MGKLTPRYTPLEYESEGFRHFLDPKVICIEHYKPIKPGPVLSHGRKPAA